jgi:hypothetical protein
MTWPDSCHKEGIHRSRGVETGSTEVANMLKLSALSLSALFLMLTASGCAANTDDVAPEDEESDTQALLAGTQHSPHQVATLLRHAGFPESAIGPMVCTAKYESNFYDRASNHNHNGTTDYGLFQINSIHLHDAGCPSTTAALYDPATNVRCAHAVWKSQGINAWYGYQHHRSTCQHYAAP